MNREKMIDFLRKIDFRIGSDGFIRGTDDRCYGYIRNTDIRTSNGEYVSFQKAHSINFEGLNNTLTLYDSDGNEMDVIEGEWLDKEFPKIRTDSDGAIIVSNKPPSTDSELNDIFTILYPDVYDKLYYDTLLERIMVDLSLFDQRKEIVPLTDEVENIYIDHIERRLKENGFVGRPPSVEIRRRVLSLQAHRHRRNRFREWVESLVWDGKPRIATWFKKVFNAEAPPLQELGLEDEYLAKVAEAWFIGGIKRMYSKTQHDVVPVLIGGQGIGKSTGLKYSAGSSEWFIDTVINISAPGGVTQFLDSVRGRIVVELAEASTIRSADQEALKAFISKTEDQYRKPYARYDETYPRHFILAASTNIANVFTDITGNRRFYPIYCKQLSKKDRAKVRDPYDAEQVWAEALALYNESVNNGDGKHVWYLSNIWKPAVIMQKYSTQDNMNVSLIEDWLDDEGNGFTEVGSKITRKTIIEECFGLDAGRPLPKDYMASLKAWMNGTSNWQKTMGRIGADKTPSRGWIRINSPGCSFVYDEEEIEAEIAEMEKDAISQKVSRDALVDHMRKVATECKLKDFDEFPINGFSKTEIDALLDEGYICVDKYDSNWEKCKYIFVGTP